VFELFYGLRLNNQISTVLPNERNMQQADNQVLFCF